MKKSVGRKIANIGIVAVPVILGGAGYALTKNIAFFTLGTGVSIAGGTAIKISDHLDYVDNSKKKSKKKKMQEVVKEDEGIQNELERSVELEKESEDLIQDEVKEPELNTASDALTEEIASSAKEETKEEYLDKNQTKKQISKEVLLYSKTNSKPIFKVNEKEWNAFFDATYDFFLSKDMQEEYYKYLSYLNRRVFADALVSSDDSISLESYVSSLPIFVSEQITDDDINYLSHEIYSRVESPNVISLVDYMNRHDKQR